MLGQNLYVESCAVFTSSYSDRGLLGVYGISYPDKAGEIKTFITKAMVGLTEEHLIDDLLSLRRRPEQDAATVMGQIRREVLHIHKLDICLRDLKPENSCFSGALYRAQRPEAHRLRPVLPMRADGGPHRGRRRDELRGAHGPRLEPRQAV